jgi:hypothetical protein
MSESMEWPMPKAWKALEPSERVVLAAHLVKEAHERAFEARLGLSANERKALTYLLDALQDCGYELHVTSEHAFRRIQEAANA